MTVIRFRPKYDTNLAELKLTRVDYFLRQERSRALRENDAQDVYAIDAGLQTVQSLLKTVKEENLESWTDRKAA
jgi:hypothetical protein